MVNEAAVSRSRRVVRAGLVSLGVGALILGVKFAAWLATGSTALLADALESIVNVVAAALATYSVAVAARPADEDHPYGHGKAEFLSAAVEGSLILVAATMIVAEAVHRMLLGPELKHLGVGVLLAGIGAVANFVLGNYLVREGREHRSEALEADGRHILTDVVTTLGSIGALAAVWLTGWLLLDPLVGIAVAVNIVRTGWQVVRRSLSGLLDEADFEFLSELALSLEGVRRPDWLDIHQLRTRPAGPVRHIDLHLVVPRYYTIDRAHVVADELEKLLIGLAGENGDVVVHVDPCRPWQCTGCVMEDCTLRVDALRERFPFDVQSLTRMGRL